MSDTWQGKIVDLNNYISEHPGIIIADSGLTIPESYRIEFHQQFNEVRRSFITERLSSSIELAEPVCRGFIEAKDKIQQVLSLKNVTIPDRLDWFVKDPIDGLSRELWILLYDLLKKRMDISTFEEEATKKAELMFGVYYRIAYQDWIELSLANMLKPERLLRVDVLTTRTDFDHAEGEAVLLHNIPSPPPKESSEISFIRGLAFSTFTAPDFIIFSAKIGKYIAFRADVRQATWISDNPSENREWQPHANDKAIFKPNYILLYVDEKPEHISLVADADKICVPDIILEIREREGWLTEKELHHINHRRDILKPRIGTYIISKEPVAKNIIGLNQDIKTIIADLNSSGLAPIIDALNEPKLKDS